MGRYYPNFDLPLRAMSDWMREVSLQHRHLRWSGRMRTASFRRKLIAEGERYALQLQTEECKDKSPFQEDLDGSECSSSLLAERPCQAEDCP